MKNVYQLIFVAFIPIIASDKPSEEIVWEIPFDKSKVNYHRSRICITIKGKTNCLTKNLQPGNPQEISDMFKIMEKHSKLPHGNRPRGLKGSAVASGAVDEGEAVETGGENGADGPLENAGNQGDDAVTDPQKEEDDLDDTVPGNPDQANQNEDAAEPETPVAGSPEQTNHQEDPTEDGTPVPGSAEQTNQEDPTEPGTSAEKPQPQPNDAAFLRTIDYLDDIKKWGPQDEKRQGHRRVMRIY